MTDFVPDSPVFSILQFFQPLAYSAIINFCVFCAYVFRVSFCVFWCVAFCCPCVYTYDSKSIAGVPTGRKRFRATLLLYTTCMCSQRLWGGSGVYDSVAVLQTNKQTNKQTIGPLKATGKGHALLECRGWIPNLGALPTIASVSLTHVLFLFAYLHVHVSCVHDFVSTCLSSCVLRTHCFVFCCILINNPWNFNMYLCPYWCTHDDDDCFYYFQK